MKDSMKGKPYGSECKETKFIPHQVAKDAYRTHKIPQTSMFAKTNISGAANKI